MTLEEVRHKLRDSSWQDKSVLIYEYHEQQLKIHGVPVSGVRDKKGWSIRNTASALSLSIATISYDLRLGRAITLNPEKFKEIKTRNQAIDVLNRGDDLKVEVKYARSFVSGSIVKVVDDTHYVIKLDKPIQSQALEITHLFIPKFYCRTFRE